MKVYGCDVTVAIRVGAVATVERTFHWRGSEASCRRKGMLKTCAARIVSVKPLDEKSYTQAYGTTQRM